MEKSEGAGGVLVIIGVGLLVLGLVFPVFGFVIPGVTGSFATTDTTPPVIEAVNPPSTTPSSPTVVAPGAVYNMTVLVGEDSSLLGPGTPGTGCTNQGCNGIVDPCAPAGATNCINFLTEYGPCSNMGQDCTGTWYSSNSLVGGAQFFNVFAPPIVKTNATTSLCPGQTFCQKFSSTFVLNGFAANNYLLFSYDVVDAGGNRVFGGNWIFFGTIPSSITPMIVNSQCAGTTLSGAPAVSCSASMNGGSPPYSYLWKWGDGQTSSGSVSANAIVATHTYSGSSVYNIVLTITDLSTPPQMVTRQALINSAGTPMVISFNWSPNPVGPTTPITFNATATGGNPPYTYTWNFNDGTSSNINPAVHSFFSQGRYNVTLTVQDSSGTSLKITNPVSVTQTSSAVVTGVPLVTSFLPSWVPLWLFYTVTGSALITIGSVTIYRSRK